MKKLYFLFLAAMIYAAGIKAQDSYVSAGENYVAQDILVNYDLFSTFDIRDGLLYGNEGDTIRVLDLATGNELATYAKPDTYDAFPSFITVNENGTAIWAGYTVTGNSDDRIYRIPTSTGTWHHEATLTGNFDLEIFNGYLIADGAVYGEPNKIYLLDTTGNDDHRLLVETGGNSAGFAIDASGNLYYGTSFTNNNQLVRFSGDALLTVMEDTTASPLPFEEGAVLTNIPAGAYDTDVDQAGNVVFTFNDYSSDKVIAIYNSSSNTYDTLATTGGDYDWFTMVKTIGDVKEPGEHNGAFVLSYARPVVKVNGDNYGPVVAEPFETLQTVASIESIFVDLNNHFTDPDDVDNFSYTVSSSNSEVAGVSVQDQILQIEIVAPGQTTIYITATNAGRSVSVEMILGAYPEITGDYTVSDFEGMGLGADDYWNGSDASGGFTSGLLAFPNNYNPDYGSWNGWAYSTVTDDSTAGYGNQYSAITGSGFDSVSSDGATYGVSYASGMPVISIDDENAHRVKGFYVTNNTYAALSMKYGDAFTKKFGGVTGSDPDWFKLQVWGFYNEMPTDTISFYLADYRFEDNSKDYIVETWQWIDLESLGFVDSLQMALSSSDEGQWGMNTPAYYCADNFYVGQAEVGIERETTLKSEFALYPNPAKERVTVSSQSTETFSCILYDYTGKALQQIKNALHSRQIDLSAYPDGMYILKIQNGQQITTKRIVKQ